MHEKANWKSENAMCRKVAPVEFIPKKCYDTCNSEYSPEQNLYPYFNTANVNNLTRFVESKMGRLRLG